jgi:hypothetical protein
MEFERLPTTLLNPQPNEICTCTFVAPSTEIDNRTEIENKSAEGCANSVPNSKTPTS